MFLEGGCNFQTGFCGWYNAAMGDDFDWTVHAGSTASSATGPRADHNGNTNGSFFLLTEYNTSLKNFFSSYANFLIPLMGTMHEPGMILIGFLQDLHPGKYQTTMAIEMVNY